MKRLISAIILVIFLIVISLASNIFLNISSKNISKKLEEVYFLGKIEDYSNCKVKLDAAIAEYKSTENYYVIIIRSTPLELINEKINSLEYYLEFRDMKMFCIETKKVITLITHICDMENPTVNNIF